MAGHTLGCGGRLLRCVACGTEVPLRFIGKHVHEDCEVIKGFISPSAPSVGPGVGVKPSSKAKARLWPADEPARANLVIDTSSTRQTPLPAVDSMQSVLEYGATPALSSKRVNAIRSGPTPSSRASPALPHLKRDGGDARTPLAGDGDDASDGILTPTPMATPVVITAATKQRAPLPPGPPPNSELMDLLSLLPPEAQAAATTDAIDAMVSTPIAGVSTKGPARSASSKALEPAFGRADPASLQVTCDKRAMNSFVVCKNTGR